jgi:hypothetical protein
MLSVALATLVLKARSETIGYAGGSENSVNSKREIRKPKRYQNNNDQNLERTAINPGPLLFWSFVFRTFGFVSYFDIRISDFR